jgi:hypothetical protein
VLGDLGPEELDVAGQGAQAGCEGGCFGPLAAMPAAAKASPTVTSMAVNHGLAAGASLSARTESATSTPDGEQAARPHRPGAR